MSDFKLRQQTPHIHFLHKQPGPALRITELKAKLDRFIVKHHFQNQFEQAKEYLVGFQISKPNALLSKWDQEHFCALDYRLKLTVSDYEVEKMWIVSSSSSYLKKAIDNESPGDLCLTDTPYFADNDKRTLKDGHLKKGIMHERPLELMITTFHETLTEAVKKFLPLLLALENFGSRQSKGFGGYWVDGADYESQLRTLVGMGEISSAWKSKPFNKDRLNEIFKQISFDYRILKSGFNHPNDSSKYRKSLLFEYFASGNVRWEKRKIKQEINRNGGTLKYMREPIDLANGRSVNSWGDPAGTDYDYRYIRALLGLAEQYEFQSTTNDKIKVKINHNHIKRFKSPITIKVVNGCIYWLALSNKTDAIIGESFEFSAEVGSRKLFGGYALTTPANFDLDVFLTQAMPAIGNYTKLPL